jgi:hypothetical protein
VYNFENVEKEKPPWRESTRGGRTNPMKISNHLRATAYHEAGHAIAAWRLRLRVSKVTVEPDEDFSGMVAHSSPFRRSHMEGLELGEITPSIQRRAENLMVISLAGPAAQRNFNPQSVRIYHSNSDHKAVCAILERLVEPSSDVFPAYYRLMKLRAEALVQNDVNWSAIEILARELLQRRTLKGSALREFISSRCFGLHEVVSPVR